jgi:hypothetical protein
MAGILESLAMGLRQAGGVLNPAVQGILANESSQDQAFQRNVELKQFENRLAMEREKASPEYQARVEALNNERGFRQAVAGANGDLVKISQAAMQFGKPEISMKIYEGAESRKARIQEAQIKAQERLDALQMRLEDQALNREQRAELARQADETRRFLGGLTAQNAAIANEIRLLRATSGGQNRPPPGYRWTPDGNQEVIPGGPADVKAAADAKKKADGADDVEVSLTTLRDAYSRLERGGGITSTDNSALGNLIPSASSSVAGQAVGRALGTNNQSARNDIAMARPALLAALMKATGMSAKQMDSNAELKLWLSTATDPTLDVQANRRALDNIERKYLRNGPTPSARPTKPATPAPPAGFEPD